MTVTLVSSFKWCNVLSPCNFSKWEIGIKTLEKINHTLFWHDSLENTASNNWQWLMSNYVLHNKKWLQNVNYGSSMYWTTKTKQKHVEDIKRTIFNMSSTNRPLLLPGTTPVILQIRPSPWEWCAAVEQMWGWKMRLSLPNETRWFCSS